MKIKNKYVIIQKNDSKSKNWGSAGCMVGLEFVAQAGSPMKAPIFLLKCILFKGRSSAYIIRYLNDYPSVLKSLARLGAECLLLFICSIFRIKIFWICHNVDRESLEYHPVLTKLRRLLITKCANRIFVIDKGLVSQAKVVFKKQAHKIEAVSFGRFEWKETRSEIDLVKLTSTINSRRTTAREQNFKFLTMLCAGSYVKGKTLHYDTMIDFIEQSKKNGYYILAIIAGDFDTETMCSRLSEQYENCENIIFFNRYTVFPYTFIRNQIDFYYRGYSDFSVPYTVYEAASLEIPILALNSGFLPTMIIKYKLGAVVDKNFCNLEQALIEMSMVTKRSYDSFFNQNKWCSLANSLKYCIDQS